MRLAVLSEGAPARPGADQIASRRAGKRPCELGAGEAGAAAWAGSLSNACSLPIAQLVLIVLVHQLPALPCPGTHRNTHRNPSARCPAPGGPRTLARGTQTKASAGGEVPTAASHLLLAQYPPSAAHRHVCSPLAPPCLLQATSCGSSWSSGWRRQRRWRGSTHEPSSRRMRATGALLQGSFAAAVAQRSWALFSSLSAFAPAFLQVFGAHSGVCVQADRPFASVSSGQRCQRRDQQRRRRRCSHLTRLAPSTLCPPAGAASSCWGPRTTSTPSTACSPQPTPTRRPWVGCLAAALRAMPHPSWPCPSLSRTTQHAPPCLPHAARCAPQATRPSTPRWWPSCGRRASSERWGWTPTRRSTGGALQRGGEEAAWGTDGRERNRQQRCDHAASPLPPTPSLELHLPYIVHVMRGHPFTLVPIVVGAVSAESGEGCGGLHCMCSDQPPSRSQLSLGPTAAPALDHCPCPCLQRPPTASF